jgi:MoaA/NifB/PqqE/SkfB family radical SAM enzyme
MSAGAAAYLQAATRQIREWQGGGRPGPLVLELFPTNRCNLLCRHCWQRTGDYDTSFRSELSDERILRLVDEAAELGVRFWIVKGGGEPMARGRLLMRVFRRIRELGMNGLLHTNGTLFKDEQIDALVEMGWQQVFVSLDAPDAASNDLLRGDGFAAARAALERFRDARRAAGRTLPVLSLNHVITRLSHRRLVEMVELAHELGCANVEFSGLIRFTELCDEFALGPEERQELKEGAAAALRRAGQLGVATSLRHFLGAGPPDDPNDRRYGAERPEPAGVLDALCFKPFTELTVHANGRVGPCCMSDDPDADSLHRTSLREAWLGPYLERARLGFRRNRPMPYCSICPTGMYQQIGELRRFASARLPRPAAEARP